MVQEFPGSLEGRYDYATAEHYTGQAWIDGKPVYRRVIEFIGGNNTSLSGAIAELNNINRETVIRVDFALRSPFSGSLIFLPEGIQVADATGELTVSHTGVDFTGLQLHCIVEYTRAET